MALGSLNIHRHASFYFALGGVLLALGSTLLAFEGKILAAWVTDVGPWGANFVVLGAVISASGFWGSWRYMDAQAGLIVAGLLMTFGVILLVVSLSVEPLLSRIVAVAALVSGIRGGAYHLGGLLPRLRHDGVMPLGEKAALFSLIASSSIFVYLIYKSHALGLENSASVGGEVGILTATALIVGGILFAESFLLSLLRKSEDTETLEDERDAEIREQAGRFAHSLLVTVVVILVVQLGVGSALGRAGSANDILRLSTPLAIAHAFLSLLFLSQCGRSVAEIWQYRRARI